MNIGIVGLGLIGASFAMSIRAHTDATILGFDRDLEVLKRALSDHTIDALLEDTRIADCDLLLLALYPQDAVSYIESKQHLVSPECCVVDLCGVKRSVCNAITPIAQRCGFYYVGGHPMAGRERSGYDSAIPTLFSGASMILTPDDRTPQELRIKLEQFFLQLGFRQIQIATPAEHDRMISYTSQLAHVLSNAYVRTDAALKHKGYSAGSFLDLTRVALLNVPMWTELFLQNKDYLADDIDALCDRLTQYSTALRTEDEDTLAALLEEGCEWKKKTL